MSNLRIIKGNIFASTCQTVVNTVNCVGVMGAGLALECRLRYPDMYSEYKQLCDQELLSVGNLWLYKATDRWILNFPTKIHWKYPSKKEYLHLGLSSFLESYASYGITSVAFPLLGAQNGGMDPVIAQSIMTPYLSRCSIPVEIYHYDPSAPDDIYLKFKQRILSMSTSEIKAATGIGANRVMRLVDALHNPLIVQLNALASVKGVGMATLESLYAYAVIKQANQDPLTEQLALEI